MSVIQGPIEKGVKGAFRMTGSPITEKDIAQQEAKIRATVMADGAVTPAEMREANAVLGEIWKDNARNYGGHESSAQLDQYQSVLEGELQGSVSPEREAEIKALLPRVEHASAITRLAENVDAFVAGAAADQSALTRLSLALLDRLSP